MMKAIQLFIKTGLACVLMIGTSMAGDWLTDIDTAVVQAKKENKPVMVEFTGSDWCPPCMMMHKEVFSKKKFLEEASSKYILVKIDIPKADKELYAKNQKVLGKYKVQGVPTVILLNKEGKEFDRFSATEYPKVKSFLAHLDEALVKKDMD